ncbi:expansin EXLX1 family cellulose-binding protein [Kitasatospora sp. NPDC101447]|uniref:expansin EXLX1 family cellulose-binding protein n=1 Tax=Kitasatospora sp. NPDC101447 TaxID=3364102 RepID=UPI003815A946
MRATKHADPRARRRQGLVVGIPLALAAVGVLLCLSLALLPGNGDGPGTEAAQPAGASVAATGTSAPPGTGVPAEATPPPSPSSASSPSPAATATPSPSATPTPTLTARPSASTATPSASAAAGATGGAGTVTSAAPLAGRIKPGTSHPGVATSYDAADGNGACSFGPSGDLMVAAMNHTDYEVSRACGAYVLVRAAGGASITVRIVNECPLPCAPGQLDLSHEAFAKLAELSVGRLPITWTLLSPGSAPDTVSVRYKTGSTQWWCGIQVIGHRNPVATLEVRSGGGWRRLSRTDYNYFLSPDGGGCGGAIRVTDVYGEQLTVDGIAVKPDVVQPTRVQFARH